MRWKVRKGECQQTSIKQIICCRRHVILKPSWTVYKRYTSCTHLMAVYNICRVFQHKRLKKLFYSTHDSTGLHISSCLPGICRKTVFSVWHLDDWQTQKDWQVTVHVCLAESKPQWTGRHSCFSNRLKFAICDEINSLLSWNVFSVHSYKLSIVIVK
jgi:hypothetical protein